MFDPASNSWLTIAVASTWLHLFVAPLWLQIFVAPIWLQSFVASVRVTSQVHHQTSTPWKMNLRLKPIFGDSPTNQTILSGQTAYLNCRVLLLGNRTVSWMRAKDFHILSMGSVTFTTDDRIKVIHDPKNGSWGLQIRYSVPSDSGVYKCQVNSRPKLVRNFFLKVSDKSNFGGQLYRMSSSNSRYVGYDTCIAGPLERYVQVGSTLTLECVVSYVKEPPSSLLWYKGNAILDYDSPRGGISLKMEKTGDQTLSTLLMSSVRREDSGNYTCLPFGAPSASTVVHVKNDEDQIALQQRGGGSGVSLGPACHAIFACHAILACHGILGFHGVAACHGILGFHAVVACHGIFEFHTVVACNAIVVVSLLSTISTQQNYIKIPLLRHTDLFGSIPR